MMGLCKDCRFWSPTPGRDNGHMHDCHLLSGDVSDVEPKAHPYPQAGANFAAFETASDFGCLQFEEKQEDSDNA